MAQGNPNADGEDEHALVIRCRDSGDRAAFEELVRRSARGLFARIYVEVGDPHRAEDLVQETLLRAWRSMASLSDPKTFRGWLGSIAHGVVIDAARRDGRRKRRALGGAGSDAQTLMTVADAAATPAESAASEEQRQRVLAMLRNLPAEYRDVLTLRYLAGADYETIAQQLAISNGSLRGLLSRGMRMLRERMKAEG